MASSGHGPRAAGAGGGAGAPRLRGTGRRECTSSPPLQSPPKHFTHHASRYPITFSHAFSTAWPTLWPAKPSAETEPPAEVEASAHAHVIALGGISPGAHVVKGVLERREEPGLLCLHVGDSHCSMTSREQPESLVWRAEGLVEGADLSK